MLLTRNRSKINQPFSHIQFAAYPMNNPTRHREGLLAGGNFIIDNVKLIDTWPGQESLANIRTESVSNGGGPYNVLKDLALLKAGFPLQAIGLIGDDERGRFILADCERHGIDTSGILTIADVPTAYTDVMTVGDDGKRTFFHHRGANILLSERHFDLEGSTAKILYIAYLMLLDNLDRLDNNGVSGASRIFRWAKQLGFCTATDLVSVNRPDFKQVITSSLPFIDYLFVNEFEAEKLTGIIALPNGQPNKEACQRVCQSLLAMGVRQCVVLHFPQGAVSTSAYGETCWQGSIRLPPDLLVGAVGAGDAFAAGVLLGVHENWPMQHSLELGVCSSAASLMKATCSDGVLPVADCLAISRKFGYRTELMLGRSPSPKKMR